MIGQVVVPTADRAHRPVSARHGARAPLLTLALVATLLLWPALTFAASPSKAPVDHPTLVAAPDLTTPAPRLVSGPVWRPSTPLVGGAERVVGAGSAVLAVVPGGLWPVLLLADDGWRRLLGIPPGYRFVDRVVVERPNGFAVVGVSPARTVVFDFHPDGRFAGATTVFDLVAGAVTSLGDAVVVFDEIEPRGSLVAAINESFTTPGRVTSAAAGGSWLVVRLSDGSVHASRDRGSGWTRLGEGFGTLLQSDPVVAVGESASLGLHRFEPGHGLVRLERAPHGPTAAWGAGVAVHDWSTVWTSTSAGWDRLPLGRRHGFTDTFVGLVDGAAVPTVVASDAQGRAVVWQIEH